MTNIDPANTAHDAGKVLERRFDLRLNVPNIGSGFAPCRELNPRFRAVWIFAHAMIVNTGNHLERYGWISDDIRQN
jgi:hypothetical protein